MALSNEKENNGQALGAFMTGMRYHDIAKPFFLANEKHTIAGFLMLDTIGRHSEAIYALLHNLKQADIKSSFLINWQKTNHATKPKHSWLTPILKFLGRARNDCQVLLPCWAPYAPIIDQLASSANTGLGDGEREMPGSGEIFSIQNPFTRLPVLNECVQNDLFGTSDQGRDMVQKELWQYEGFDKVCGRKQMEDFVKDINSGGLNFDTLRATLETGKAAIQEFFNRFDHSLAHSLFSERTYPSANDTSLLEHGRLCENLALMVGANMLLNDNNRAHFDPIPLDSVISWDKEAITKRVLPHINGLLVRISFDNLKNLYESAIRVDDMHGVREFLGKPGQGGKTLRAMYCEGIDALVAEIIGDESINGKIRPLNDFPFELIYLLPNIDREKFQKRANALSFDIAKKTADELNNTFIDDFKKIPAIEGAQPVPSLDGQLLVELIKPFLPNVHIQPICPQPSDIGLSEAKIEFSKVLTAGYQSVRQHAETKPADCNFHIKSAMTRSSDAGSRCDVCGLNEPFTEFYAYYDRQANEGRDFLHKVMFDQKEEPERLCAFCLCLRVLSHGKNKLEWLSKLLSYDDTARQVRISPTATGAFIPPSLKPACRIEPGSASTMDMEACFVRKKSRELEVYPTIGCVADQNSNVALLCLEAGAAVYETYDFQNIAMGVGILAEDDFHKKAHKIRMILQHRPNDLPSAVKDWVKSDPSFKDLPPFEKEVLPWNRMSKTLLHLLIAQQIYSYPSLMAS